MIDDNVTYFKTISTVVKERGEWSKCNAENKWLLLLYLTWTAYNFPSNQSHSQCNFHSPCISTDIASCIIVSLSYENVRKISWAYCWNSLIIIQHFPYLSFNLFHARSPPMQQITIGTISILKPGLLSLNSNANCWCGTFEVFRCTFHRCSSRSDIPW